LHLIPGSSLIPACPSSDHATGTSGKSALVKAVRCALRHRPGLVLFLEDGRLELDTNTIERAIRPIALGRKNALVAGSDGGARQLRLARHKGTPAAASRAQSASKTAGSAARRASSPSSQRSTGSAPRAAVDGSAIAPPA
jgi:hypothetical protein